MEKLRILRNKFLGVFLFYVLFGWPLSLLYGVSFAGVSAYGFYMGQPRHGIFWAYVAVLCGLISLCQYRTRRDILKAYEHEKAKKAQECGT